jgi:hypothetical protein
MSSFLVADEFESVNFAIPEGLEQLCVHRVQLARVAIAVISD